MKINGMPIQTPQKENTSPAGKGAALEPKDQKESGGVILNVSQRNAVSAGGEAPEMDKGAVSGLMKSLAENPENTSKLHAVLSPERVLQLLG